MSYSYLWFLQFRETFIKFFMTHAGATQEIATAMYNVCLMMAYNEDEQEIYENSIDDAIALLCEAEDIDWTELAILIWTTTYN